MTGATVEEIDDEEAKKLSLKIYIKNRKKQKKNQSNKKKREKLKRRMGMRKKLKYLK